MSTNYLTPLGDNILVELDISDEKTQGGIYLPEESRDKMNTGTVLKENPKFEDIKEGDYVLFIKYSGTPVDPVDANGTPDCELIPGNDIKAKLA